MTIASLIAINSVLALLLFLINGLIGKWKVSNRHHFDYSSFGFYDINDKNFSGNFFQMIVNPAVFLAILSVILQQFSLECLIEHLWLLTPLYWCVRLFHILFWNHSIFVNWRYEFVAFVLSLLLSEGILFGVILPLISKGESVAMDLGQLRDAIWFAIITYLFTLFWKISKQYLTGKTLYPEEKREYIIKKRYSKFNKKYDAHICSTLDSQYSFKGVAKRRDFILLLYSIMVYEDHNRPICFRILEYICKLLRPRATMSLGIMQVQTRKIIGNKKSITLAIEKMYSVYSGFGEKYNIYDVIADYNPSEYYYDEVRSIYECLSMNYNSSKNN